MVYSAGFVIHQKTHTLWTAKIFTVSIRPILLKAKRSSLFEHGKIIFYAVNLQLGDSKSNKSHRCCNSYSFFF